MRSLLKRGYTSCMASSRSMVRIGKGHSFTYVMVPLESVHKKYPQWYLQIPTHKEKPIRHISANVV